MRSTDIVHIVSCHAEGEVGDVIIGGVAPPPGKTLWDQSRWIARDQSLLQFVLNEPRGGVFRHVNLLVPPINEQAVYGFIIMEPAHTPPMSGSNTICVATVLLDTGLVPMVEPETVFCLEAPAGPVQIRAFCENGKTISIEFQNVASFADVLGATIEVEGIGSLTVDTAYGGDSFVLVDAARLGFDIVPAEARDMAHVGRLITRAANEQIEFQHPVHREWSHLSFCQFTGPLECRNGTLHGRNAVVIEPAKIDRSPTGTGCSARMAILHARGEMQVGDHFIAESIIGSTFECGIVKNTTVAGRPAIVPTVRGRAWITGTHQLMRDPDDPWPLGYRLTDTWP